jgi:hypothetical protein
LRELGPRLLRGAALHGWLPVVMLLAVVALLRSASLAYAVMDIDEAHWTLIGRILLDGGAPYLDFADHKPPLLFYTFASFVALTDGDLRGIHALMVLWIAATALIVGAAARRLGGSRETGALAALVYALLCCCNVQTANSELLADLPLAAGLYFVAGALRPATEERSRTAGAFVLAGLLCGIAVMVRLQSGVGLIAMFGALLASRLTGGRRGWLGGSALLVGGFLLPLAVTAAVYAATGQLELLWDWTVRRNITYPPPANWMVEMAGAVGLFGVSLAWALLLAARPVGRVLAGLGGRGRPRPEDVLPAFLLLLSCLAVAQGRRFYPHYFIQLAMPLALLVGPRLEELARDESRRARRLLAAACACAALAPAGFAAFGWARGLAGGYPDQDGRSRAVVQYLREAAPHGRILVWGDSTQIYVHGRRFPGSRFYNAAPLVGNFDTQQVPDGFDFTRHISERDVRLYLDDAERLKPVLFIDTSTGPIHCWHRFPFRRVAAIRDYIDRRYRLAARPGGVEVYQRL